MRKITQLNYIEKVRYFCFLLFFIFNHLSSQTNNSLNFDGINDYVNLGDTLESLTNCTIETWVYYDSSGTSIYHEIYSKQYVNSLNIWKSGGNKVWFHLGNGTSWFDGGEITSNSSIPSNEWTHIAVTWEQATSTIKIYINGILDKTSSHTHSSGSVMGNSSFSRGIGSYGQNGAQVFKGSIDDLRVWNDVRSQSEIQNNMNIELVGNESNLISYYNFNQGTANGNNTTETTLTDITSSSFNGTLTNFSLNGTSSNWTVGIEPDVTVNLNSSNVTCSGGNDGTATATVSSGTANYTYSWSNGATTTNTSATTNTITGLIAGNYSVTVTDINGKTDIKSITVNTAVDNINPTIGSISNQIQQVDDSCMTSLADYTGLAVVSDNCDTSPVVTQSPTASTSLSSTTTVVLTVTDASGNSNNTSFNVILEDNTAPTIASVSDQTQELEASCTATLADYTGLAVVSDNCDASPVITQSPVAGTTISSTTSITLIVADASGNNNSTSFEVNVFSNASFSYDASSYCADASDPIPMITGASGGTFSSTTGLIINTSTGVIDVSESTPDTYMVTYTTAGACSNSSSIAITINSVDNASFSYDAAVYCLDGADPTPTITGLAGGTFSSTTGLSISASIGLIDVSTSTPGTYTVTYTTAGSCPNSSNLSITINSVDDASFNYSSTNSCQNGTDLIATITGLAGGSFSSAPAGLTINGSTGAIDVSTSTPGTYTVTYTTAGVCPNSSSIAITINSLDDASFSYDAAVYCLDGADPTPTITGLAGGTFSSTTGLSISASTGLIDVSASTPGTYTVTYTTAGSCSNSSNLSVTINSVDDASFNYSSTNSCQNGTDLIATITGLAGGSFSSAPAGLTINGSTGAIDVSTSTPGTYTVTYTTAGVCPNSSSVAVTVNALDDASFSYDESSYDTAGIDPTASVSGLIGGVFSSTSGLSINATDGTIDLSASTPATYIVTYTTSETCSNSATFEVTITAAVLSIADNIIKEFKMYPTPAVDKLTISIPVNTVSIYNTLGILVLKTNESVISVQALPPGLYFVTIETDKGSVSKKLIKN